jgi:hypothetical protein
MRLRTIEQAFSMNPEKARELIVDDFANNSNPPVDVLMFVIDQLAKRRMQSHEQIFKDIRADGYARGGRKTMFDQSAESFDATLN